VIRAPRARLTIIRQASTVISSGLPVKCVSSSGCQLSIVVQQDRGATVNPALRKGDHMNRFSSATSCLFSGIVIVAISLNLDALGQGECQPDWSDQFAPAVRGRVDAAVSWDQANGQSWLVIGGELDAVLNVEVRGVAAFDGDHWSPIGPGIDGAIHALAVFDDGSGVGPQLYAGGRPAWNQPQVGFIWKWTGSTWEIVSGGVDNTVGALLVYEDGSGSALYVGGSFRQAGGMSAAGIARWNGSEWSAVGEGVNGPVFALCAYQRVSTESVLLIAGGEFSIAGNDAASNIAQWNGQEWSALGQGTSGHVSALVQYSDDVRSDERSLFAGGSFFYAGGMIVKGIARWNGFQWSDVAGGVGSEWPGSRVSALTVYDDGQGETLWVAGNFTSAGTVPANSVARMQHGQWSAVGLTQDQVLLEGVYDVAWFQPTQDDPAEMWAVGQTMVQWDGQRWHRESHSLASGNSVFATSGTRCLGVFDDGLGGGPQLFVGGDFVVAENELAHDIARWNGAGWSPVGLVTDVTSPSQVNALAVFDDGTGAALYVGGYFEGIAQAPARNLAKWNGSDWLTVGGPVVPGDPGDPSGGSPEVPGYGVNGSVNAMTVFDDGSGAALYVAGDFSYAGEIPVNRIARWKNGQWSDVGGGTNGAIYDMEVFDDGSGTALYVGGAFTVAGGDFTRYMARWNGSEWSSLGAGLDSLHGYPTYVYRLATIPASLTGQRELVAGGVFHYAGDIESHHFARWDGTQWRSLDIGFEFSYIRGLGVVDHPALGHPVLYASGIRVTHHETVDFQGVLARWDGLNWSATVDEFGEPDSYVRAHDLLVFDDGQSEWPVLYAAGDIAEVNGMVSGGIARLQLCPVPEPTLGDITGDGVVGIDDLIMVINSWGPCPPVNCLADLNDDGFVNIDDLLLLINNWN
jgi:hypothetical protein